MCIPGLPASRFSYTRPVYTRSISAPGCLGNFGVGVYCAPAWQGVRAPRRTATTSDDDFCQESPFSIPKPMESTPKLIPPAQTPEGIILGSDSEALSRWKMKIPDHDGRRWGSGFLLGPSSWVTGMGVHGPREFAGRGHTWGPGIPGPGCARGPVSGA